MKFDKPVPGGPCWTELGTNDIEGAKRFYTELFGWRPETDPRHEAGGYTMAHLGDAAVAGLTPLTEDGSMPVAWHVTFAVADAEATCEAVRRAGGSIVMEPTDVFDLGRFAVAGDPGGAGFRLWQARAFAGAGLFNAPGALGWVELLTRDAEQAMAFYRQVFGWSVNASPQYTQWGVDGADFGGMMEMGDRFPLGTLPHWLPYFAVDDVDATARIASGAGAWILVEPTSVPDGPRIAVLRDPQGAVFGVYVGDEDG